MADNEQPKAWSCSKCGLIIAHSDPHPCDHAVPMSRRDVLGWIAASDLSDNTKNAIIETVESWHERRKTVEAERDEFRHRLALLRQHLYTSADAMRAIPRDIWEATDVHA